MQTKLKHLQQQCMSVNALCSLHMAVPEGLQLCASAAQPAPDSILHPCSLLVLSVVRAQEAKTL